MSLNPVHGEVYSIQHTVIKFVSDLRQVGRFSLGTLVSSINKTDRHNITEILLSVFTTNFDRGDFRIIDGEKIRSRVGRPPVCSV